VGLQPALVFRTRGVGFEINVLAAFDILKQHRAVEVEGEFVRVEHLEYHRVVAGGGKPAEIALQFVHGREQVGNENDHAAFAGQFRGAAERFSEVGSPTADLFRATA